ncbi:unnamed protein product [Chrysoparadoxa australica]
MREREIEAKNLNPFEPWGMAELSQSSPQLGASSMTRSESISGQGDILPDFEASDFYVNPESVVLGPPVGEGAFSTVYCGRYFGDVVAVKMQTRKGADLEKYLLRELSVLKYIRHEGMLEYIGAYNVIAKSRGQLHAVYIITEYAQGGDVLKLLVKPNTPLGWKFRIQIALEGVRALQYLHEQQLIHRDIKSSNFLLDCNWRCKLSDFGMARAVAKDGKMTICGTDEYMAPEMLFDEDFSYPADIFSFGMVLLEIITRQKVGSNKFATRTPAKLFALEPEEIKQFAPEDTPQSLLTLAIQCLEYEAEERPSASDVAAWLEDLCHDLPDDDIPVPYMPDIPEIEEEEEDDGFGDLESDFADTPMKKTVSSKSPRSSPRASVDAEGGRRSSTASTPSPARSTTSHSRSPEYGREEGASKGKFVPSKMGYLHTKNQGLGFRNWKKRWFVLKAGSLICYKDGGLIDTVDLAGCTVVRGKANRFQIVKLEEEADHRDLHSNETLELATSTQSALEAWLSCLQSSIDHANGLVETSPDAGVAARQNLDDEEVKTVEQWLERLELSHLLPQFEQNGYSDIQRVLHHGLELEDLDKIGIDNPLQRRFLLGLGRTPFGHRMKVSVVGHRSFGDVTVFKVIGEWRAWHSKTEKLYMDFNKLDNKLHRAMKERGSPLLDLLPRLPGKGKVVHNHKDPGFILLRKQALQGYLQELAVLLDSQEPYFSLLCAMLDLVPGNDENLV